MKTLHLLGLAIFCTMALLSACSGNSDNKENESLRIEERFEYAHLIPDSLQKPEQKETARLFLKTIANNLKVENNHLVIGLTKRQFVNLGLPEQYYDSYQRELDATNDMIDSLGITDMEQVLKESKPKMLEYLQNK